MLASHMVEGEQDLDQKTRCWLNSDTNQLYVS